ncbi:MAG TPA: pitrilysin family protein [Planctomycetota bacterium]|nr:pitrilysin family protein [Planctomycetota bacterium]
MRKLPALIVLALAATASAQDVSYEKTKLENGMTVILYEKHDLPEVAVNLWYRVGSKDEQVHRSGFAHLFEHLMFMGTKRVPNGDFDSIMSSGGGSNNATTSEDRTNYFSHGPAELLPTLLWLDADRLEDLGANMTQEKLDRQREVVKNERRQSHENRPYGKAELVLEEMLYPQGHPYHIPVIGTHEDLEAATVQDVKDFFATYYVPNNCSLVVAGDFDKEKTKELVKRLFGTIQKGGEPPHKTAAKVKLEEVKRATVVDKVQLPRTTIAWHSPRIFEKGDAELDLAAAVLGQGKTSRLYKRLVIDEKLCNSVRAGQDSRQLGSYFRIDATARPGADLDKVEKIIEEEVSRLADAGPTQEELDRRKAELELGELQQLQSIERVADKLNEYELYFGEPNSFKRDLDRYRSATIADVRDEARDVFLAPGRVVLRVLPETPRRPESARDQRPEAGARAAFDPKGPETFKLSNGVSVVLFTRPALPLVSSTFVFRPGGLLVDTDGQKAGLAPLTAAMLREGAGDLDALKFDETMQGLGARFGTGAGDEEATASLTVLRRNFEKAASLAADAIRRPRMEAKDWERVKRLHLESLKRRDDQPMSVASNVARRLLYGEKNPYAWPGDGSAQSVGAIELDEVKAEHQFIFRPDALTIVVAGDLTADQAKETFEKIFGDWKDTGASPRYRERQKLMARTDYPIPAADALRVAIVDRPDAVQTVIRFEMPGPVHADPRRVPLQMFNDLFGGSFTSRLNQNLREQHGYTYGASSHFSFGRSTGTLVLGSQVRAAVTGASLKEFLAEVEKIRQGGIADDETKRARETLRADSIQSTGDLGGLLGIGLGLVEHGVTFDDWKKDLARLDQVTTAELNGLAHDAVPLEKGVLVLVGDKKLILEQIKGLGLPEPSEVDSKGERKQ